MKPNVPFAAVLGAVCLGLAGVAAHAQSSTAPPPPAPPAHADFATHKARVLAHLNQRATALQNTISCVNAANDPAALKACHDQERAALEALRAQR